MTIKTECSIVKRHRIVKKFNVSKPTVSRFYCLSEFHKLTKESEQKILLVVVSI